jgi:DNA-binding transcriptional regulator GbsR (MarR family)
MQESQMTTFLNGLRGAQPMIFLCYLIVRRPMTVDEIRTYTGLSDDTIRPALKSLSSKGLFYKQIGERGRQTWLPAADTFFGRIIQNPLLAETEAVVVVNDESEECEENKLTTTSTGRQNPLKAETENEWERSILAELAECGIHGKKARELAQLDWVTPEYIRGHQAMVQGEFWDNPAGMMIYRIEGKVPVDPSKVEEKKVYKRVVVDHGKRGKETIAYTYDADGEAAEFTGHPRGCTCIDCGVFRQRGKDWLCPKCKHFNCECEEEESEEP